MKRRMILQRLLLFVVLWWILTAGHLDAWWLGLAGIAVATWASMRLSPPGTHPIQIVLLVRFLVFFVWNSLRGGWQVAMLALQPRLDLAPTLHDFHTILPPGAPRLLMLNAIGLMPGTVGVRLDGATLHLHVLDASLPTQHEARALETQIARLFGATS